MISIHADNADAAWRTVGDMLRTKGRLQNGRDQPTKELLHVGITINDPRQRLVFSRRINPAFAIAEVIWILAGWDDLSFVKYWNPRMKQYSDDGVSLCGSYGYRLGSQPKLDHDVARRLRHWSGKEILQDQIKMAYEALQHSPESRQVTLQFWNQNLDLPNPAVRSKDVPCNLISHLMIRDKKLEWLQVLRSNDFFWGLPYNIIQFTTLQEIIAGWLNIDVGSYVQISDSMHAYRRHWAELDSLRVDGPHIPLNKTDLRVSPYEDWESAFSTLAGCAYAFTRPGAINELETIDDNMSQLPKAYQELLNVLLAEALRKRGMVDEAANAIRASGKFWETSWRTWEAERPEKVPAQ